MDCVTRSTRLCIDGDARRGLRDEGRPTFLVPHGPRRASDHGDAMAGDSAVDRVLLTLEALTDNRDGVSVTELAALLEISKAQMHRTLTTMAARGYVAQDPLTE